MTGKRILGPIAVVIALFILAATPALAGNCIVKAGEGWGGDLGMAKFQSYEIIQQVTGNWPFESDKITIKSQKCRPDQGGYTCVTVASVCKAS